MEQNNGNVNEKRLEKAVERRGRFNMLLVILIILFACGAGYLWHLNRQQKMESTEMQQALEDEKNSLSNELSNLMGEYESLKTDNDSMNRKVEVQQDKIKKLLSINANNLEKIKLYKKELVTLREIMKSYIVQIDSLNQRNQQLVAENTEVKSKLDVARKNNEQLSQDKEELTQKVKQASVLSAKNVVVTLLNKRGKETSRTGKVSKIKVCFTVRENSIVPAGQRIIYLRITRPDQLVFASSQDNLFDFQGAKVVYSEKRDINYENSDIDLCIFYPVKEGEMIAGNYAVDLFTDGNLIGNTTFTIK